MKHTRKVGLILGPALFLAVLFFPTLLPEELTFEARIVLGATLWMAVWWITEAIPIYVTALLPFIIFPSLGVTELQETAASYADRIIFLFLGGFMLAKAMEKSNLHSRFALNILKIFGTNPKYIIAAFMMVIFLLGAWMSNTAITMLMLPVAIAVISQFRSSASDRERFGLCLMLSVAYSASISGVATLIASPPNAIFASVSEEIIGLEVSFSQWMAIGFPIGVISILIAWLYMVNFGVSIRDIKPIAEEKGVIETSWLEIPMPGRTFGAFQREMAESKDRSRIIMRVKQMSDVTNVNFHEERQRWAFRGGSRLFGWADAEPSQQVIADINHRLDAKLKERGCTLA